MVGKTRSTGLTDGWRQKSLLPYSGPFRLYLGAVTDHAYFVPDVEEGVQVISIMA